MMVPFTAFYSLSGSVVGVKAINCPTQGGVPLTLVGDDLTASVIVKLDGVTTPCTFNAGPKTLTCTLPAGVGVDRTGTLTNLP